MFTLYIEKEDLIELVKKKRKDILNKELSLKLIEISGNGLGLSSSNIEDNRTDIKLGYNTK